MSNKTPEELVIEAIPWIESVARKQSKKWPNSIYEDLLQDGLIGAMEAAQSFEPERGVRFQTYAQIRVIGAMLDGIRQWDWVPRLERQRQKVDENRKKPPTIQSLNVPKFNETEDFQLLTIEDRIGKEDRTHPQELTEEVARLLVGLKQRERLILLLYYCEGLSMREVGDALGINESRVSQIHDAVILRLKQREGLA